MKVFWNFKKPNCIGICQMWKCIFRWLSQEELGRRSYAQGVDGGSACTGWGIVGTESGPSHHGGLQRLPSPRGPVQTHVLPACWCYVRQKKRISKIRKEQRKCWLFVTCRSDDFCNLMYLSAGVLVHLSGWGSHTYLHIKWPQDTSAEFQAPEGLQRDGLMTWNPG